MESWKISLIINTSIFIIFFLISITVIYRLKIKQKGYKLLFITYLCFWIPLMMTREYSSKITYGVNVDLMWLVLSSYGFIGIFFRPIVDYLALRLKNRKIILYSAIVIVFISFIPFIIVQNTTTSVIQSIGIGVGASMIGMYELMFKEQYTVNKAFLTVSILALPPLLADFLSSSIQSIVTTIPKSENNTNYPYMYIWIISLFFLFFTLILLFFVKENRSLIGLKNSKNIIIQNNWTAYIWYSLICVMGFLVAFIKFSNSGSVGVLTITQINEYYKTYSSEVLEGITAYMSLLFSLFQLSSSLFIYLFVIKRDRKDILFSIGIIVWILYHLLIMFVNDSVAYFALSALNGLSYGILYNLVLGLVLALSFNMNKITPMGIYQGILSIGTTISTFLVPFIKTNLTSKNQEAFTKNNYIINGILLSLIVVLGLIYFLVRSIQHKNKEKIILNI